MQRARCYLLGESAVVLELEPPVSLASQQRIWGLLQRLQDVPGVLEAVPGMNNITVICAMLSIMRWMLLNVCNGGGKRVKPGCLTVVQ